MTTLKRLQWLTSRTLKVRKQSGPEVLKLRDWSFVGFQGFFRNMVNFYSAQSESMKGFVLKVVHLSFILNMP